MPPTRDRQRPRPAAFWSFWRPNARALGGEVWHLRSASATVQPWNGSRLRLCWIAARRIYRVFGVEHVRHRRPAAPEVVLLRLLSLDYLLEPHAAWLPTEDEKVNALTAAGMFRLVPPCPGV